MLDETRRIMNINYIKLTLSVRRKHPCWAPVPRAFQFAKSQAPNLSQIESNWHDRRLHTWRAHINTYIIKYNLHNRYNYNSKCLISHFCKCSAFGPERRLKAEHPYE